MVAITDSSGNVVQVYVYDTFGNIVQQTGSVENVYTYTGREWDAEAGLYYYRARYYDPTLGRFINGDPIGFAGGDVNFYVYVQNNPVNRIDPIGLWTFQWGTSLSGGAGVGATSGSGYVIGFSRENGFQFGSYDVTGVGAYGGAGSSVTVDLTGSANTDINDLTGAADTVGGSINIYGPFSIGGEGNIPCGDAKSSYTFSPGVSGGIPAEAHYFTTQTRVNEWFSIKW